MKKNKKTKLGQGLIKGLKEVIKKEKKPKVKLSDKKVYFVTVISAYEEVHEERIPNLEKLKHDLNELEEKSKSENQSLFMYKLRRTQLISEAVSQKTKQYNPYGKSQGYRSHRTPLFFFDKEVALLAIKENYSDCLEGGSWGNPTFVLIEEYTEGFCLVEKRELYEVNITRATETSPEKIKLKRLKKEPLWIQGSVNYAVG